MRLPRIPLFLRFLMLLVLIGAGLVALFWLIVVGPLFYACAFQGSCV